MCEECGEMFVYPTKESALLNRRLKKLKCCSLQSIIEITDNQLDLVDIQWVELVDDYSSSYGITALIKGSDMIWSLKEGDRISPTGIYHYSRIKGMRKPSAWFEIFASRRIYDNNNDNSKKLCNLRR